MCAAENKVETKKDEITEKESKTFYVMKGFFILSVIAAHVNTMISNTLVHAVITYFWNIFGTIGVIGFFLLGGFFYKRKEEDDKEFWKGKLFSIIIPWLLCSLLTFGIKWITSGINSFWDVFKWIIGYGSLYYYITIFLFFLFIFKYFYKHDWALYSCIGLTLVSLILYSFEIDYWQWAVDSKYLNPLNWIGFFAGGILIRKYRLDRILLQKWIVFAISIVLLVFEFFIMWRLGVNTYFHIITPIWGITLFVFFLWISNWIADLPIVCNVAQVGKWSYCIYLIHIQPLQFIISRLPLNLWIVALRPIIGWLIMVILLMVVCWIMRVIKLEKVLFLIGIK